MKHIFSKHALEQMELRGIDRKTVEKILAKPQQTIIEKGKKIVQSTTPFKAKPKHLIRIFVNTEKNPNVVITVYKTSKIDKYYEG